MTKIGDLYKIEVDKDGKVKVKCDEAKRLAKLPVNQRIAARKSKKTKYQKAGKISNV